MRRSFDTRVSISIENGLLIGLVQPLATLVLVSTYIYLEKAAEPRARIYSRVLGRAVLRVRLRRPLCAS